MGTSLLLVFIIVIIIIIIIIIIGLSEWVRVCACVPCACVPCVCVCAVIAFPQGLPPWVRPSLGPSLLLLFIIIIVMTDTYLNPKP